MKEPIQGILDNANILITEDKNISTLKYEISDIYFKKENEEEKIEITPRKRKCQRTLEKIDQILDNVNTPQYSKEKNILRMRYEKPEDMKDQIEGISDNVDTPQDFENKIFSKVENEITDIYLKKESEEEKVEVTPRKRKTQRSLKKINKILNNVPATPQYSKKI